MPDDEAAGGVYDEGIGTEVLGAVLLFGSNQTQKFGETKRFHEQYDAIAIVYMSVTFPIWIAGHENNFASGILLKHRLS